MADEKKEKQGRGWHGDAAGHAKAGRLGGKARAEKKKQVNNQAEKNK
jgi:hypothetical protein